MGAYRRLAGLSAATIGAAFLLFFALSSVHFKPTPLPREAEVSKVKYETLNMTTRPRTTYSGLKSPIDIPAAAQAKTAPKKDYPAVPLKTLTGGPALKEPRVSFVLVREGARIAVVEGIVVREGDRFKGAQIRKIEKRGVLIKDEEGERWLPIG